MIYLTVVSLIWAFSFGLIGNTLSGVDPFLVATLRLSIATLLFFPFLKTATIGKNESVRLALYGAVQFGLMYTCYMKAFQYLPSHLVALFSILTPVYVVLIHNVCRGLFSGRLLLVAFLSVLGAACIKVKGVPSGDIWIGFGLMQGAGLAFAYGQVAYRNWKKSRPQIKDRECFSLLTLGGTLCAGSFSLIWTDWNGTEISPTQWQSIIYLGCIASGIGFFLWNKGASRSKPGTLAAFNNAVVPLAVLCSLLVFGEIENADKETLIRLASGSVLILFAMIIGQKKHGG